MIFHEKIDLFQARAVKCFIKNWMVLLSDFDGIAMACCQKLFVRNLPEIIKKLSLKKNTIMVLLLLYVICIIHNSSQKFFI